MDRKLLIRLLTVPVFLCLFYLMGFPAEVLALFGILFLAVILLRGKVWKAADRAIERFLPFTKKWPDWAQKVLLVLIFLLIYMALKQVLYFALGIFGIDIQAMVMDAYGIGALNANAA